VAVEARSAEVRTTSASERVDEETVQRPDVNGRLVVGERVVTRRSAVNGQEQVVVETYSPDTEGFAGSEGRLTLSQRVRRSTTATSDGGRSTVEEVEARSRVAAGDPMRVIQRTVVTVRNLGPDRQMTERRSSAMSTARLTPVLWETEEGRQSKISACRQTRSTSFERCLPKQHGCLMSQTRWCCPRSTTMDSHPAGSSC
jgi:hypothetical protein